MSNSDNFQQTLQSISRLGLQFDDNRVHIKVPNAQSVLSDVIRFYLKQKGESFHPVKYTDEEGTSHRPYQEVVDWLTDNQGRGLFLYGFCGLGKTMLAYYVLPLILHLHCNKIVHRYTMTQLNDPDTLRDAMRYKILVIDDVGVEEQSVSFGQRRNVFDEIMDSAEKQGKLLIITTNLTADDIKSRYGTRTIDRIQSCCRRIMFQLFDDDNHPVSLRKKD